VFGLFQDRAMGIYLSAADFDGTIILNPEVYERIEVAVDVVRVRRRVAAATPAAR
jgi:FMN reductase